MSYTSISFLARNSVPRVRICPVRFQPSHGCCLRAGWLQKCRLQVIALSLALGCLLPGGLSADTFYASPDGSSSNDGLSTSSPWPLDYALANALQYDTIRLMDGRYTSPIDIDTPNLTVQAINKWGPQWLGVSGHAGSHDAVIQLSANNVVLDGVMVSNCQYEVCIEYSMTNCVIRNLWVAQTGNFGYGPVFGSASGIQTLPGAGHIVERCLIEFCGTNSTSGGNHGIYAGGTNCIYRNNVIRYNDGLGIILNSHGQGNDVGNQIYNNLLYGNQALNSSGGQLDLANDDHVCPYNLPNQVFGNTIVSPGRGIAVQYMAAVISNNIIISATDAILSYSSAPISADYNLAPNPIANFSGPHDVVSLNYGFVNSGNGLYWLTTNSAAYQAANGTACGPVDFFDNAQSAVTDIGAFQYNPSCASDSRMLDPSGPYPDYWANLSGTGGNGSISVSPASQSFGMVAVGSTSVQSFTAHNTGPTMLSGSASVPAPFSIVAGGSYNLAPGQTQIVIVSYSPTAAATNTALVNFTGANGATVTVSGFAAIAPPAPKGLQILVGSP